MVLRRPQRLDKYAQFFPKSRTGCPTAEPVESFCTSQPVAYQAAAAFRAATALEQHACAKPINIFNRPCLARDVTQMKAEVMAESRMKVLYVVASLESTCVDEAVLMDDFISAYRPKEVADVVSIDTDDNNASCKQVSDDVETADNLKASKPSILRHIAQRFVKRISSTKRGMSACGCFRAA